MALSQSRAISPMARDRRVRARSREIDSAPRVTPDTTTECWSERSVSQKPPQPSGPSRKSKTIENASRYRTGHFGVQTSKSADLGSGWGNAAARRELRFEPFRPYPGSQNIYLSFNLPSGHDIKACTGWPERGSQPKKVIGRGQDRISRHEHIDDLIQQVTVSSARQWMGAKVHVP